MPDHPHCHSTALVVFILYTDVTSTVMTRMQVRSSMRAHSLLSGSRVNESCAQDTEQKHCKHGSRALLSSLPLLLVAVLAEHGGCLSSVDRNSVIFVGGSKSVFCLNFVTISFIISLIKKSMFGALSRERTPLRLLFSSFFSPLLFLFTLFFHCFFKPSKTSVSAARSRFLLTERSIARSCN